MSIMTVAVTYDLIQQAFDNVDAAHVRTPGDATAGAAKAYSFAPEVKAAVAEAWLKVQALVDRCANRGREIIQSEVAAFMEYVDSTSVELETSAREFREGLLAKIREMISETFDLMLKALRSDLVVGGRRMTLKTINLEQKLLFSASLQISLTSLCELAGSGELTVTGSYEVAQ